METENIPTPVSGFNFGPEAPVGLTEMAVEKVRETIEGQKLDGHLLRIAVVGGGCSGYNYDLDLVREPRGDDLTYDCGGIPVAVDKQSIDFLNGTVIDFVESLQGAGFKFNNPKAKATCGCGTSFSA